MGYRLIQRGTTGGPFVLVYHLTGGSRARPTFVDERVRAACGPTSTIVNYTTRAKGAYQAIGAPGDGGDRLLTLAAVLEAHGGGAAKGREVVVCGFSAGCQAVRAHIAELEWTALVGVDGVHSSSPPDDAAQIQPWRVAVNVATASRRVVHFTATEIDPPGYRSVRDTLASIVPDWAGKLHAGESIDRPLVFTEGPASTQPGFADVMAFCYPGKDARAHELQAQVALPRALNFALCERGALKFNGPEFVELERVIGSSASTVEPPFSGGGVPPAERSRWLPVAGVGLATVALAGVAWWLR